MGLFGLFGRKKEVELDDNITEGILQFENLNLKLAVIQVLMYDLNLRFSSPGSRRLRQKKICLSRKTCSTH